MPVDVVGNDLNVKDLIVTPKDRGGWYFDAESDLDQDFWKFYKEDFKSITSFPNSYQLKVFWALHTINPEIKEEIKFSPEALQEVRRQVEGWVDYQPKDDEDKKRIARSVVVYAGRLKLLNPQEKPLPKDEIIKVKQVIDNDELLNIRSLERLALLRLLAEDNQELWPDILKQEDRPQIVRDLIERSATDDLFENAMWGRILLGDDFDMTFITPRRLERWRLKMEKLEPSDYKKLHNAIALKVLTAESVKIGKNGIEIVMPTKKDDVPQEKPLPERRKY